MPTNFADMLRSVLVSPVVANAQDQIGTGPQTQVQIGKARGELSGDPGALAGMAPNDLSVIDRAETQRSLTRNNPIAGLVGAPAFVATDLMKAAGLQEKVLPPVLEALGQDELAGQFKTTSNTSDTSPKQTLSNILGTLGGTGQGFVDIGEGAANKLQQLLQSFQDSRSRSVLPSPSGHTLDRG